MQFIEKKKEDKIVEEIYHEKQNIKRIKFMNKTEKI
jgi:hypothetical protein